VTSLSVTYNERDTSIMENWLYGPRMLRFPGSALSPLNKLK
jgi:hypothetical protein